MNVINDKMKYYKKTDGKTLSVNPCDYRVSYYCGAIHWINIITGKEEVIYIDNRNFKLKKNTMEVETKLRLTDNVTEESEWTDFTFNVKDVIGYYDIKNSTTRIVTSIGEFDILIPYLEFKKLKEIAYNHNSLFQFN